MNASFVPDDYFRTHSAAEIFGDGEVCEVDLGCGEGGFLSAMARRHPERLFLGVERLEGRVKIACRAAERAGLRNVRVLRIESRYLLEWFLKPGLITRLHYLFPDPWPKKKKHKKRLVQADFPPVLHRALAPGGEFLFKTDHREYFEWVNERMAGSGLFLRLEWSEDAFFYPKTDFQRQWEAKGREIFRARFRKADAA